MSKLKKASVVFLHRLAYRNPGVSHNILMWPFFLVTFALGLSFVFLEDAETVQASPLYQLTVLHLNTLTVSVWGALALVVSLGNIIALAVRVSWVGNLITWLGWGIWSYACVLYLIDNYWLQFLVSGLPNLLFWVWYWFTVRAFHRDNEPVPN